MLQSYSAYTSYLDQLDARFLSSSRAPERILYQPVTINDRDQWWEPPATLEAMYCHYRQIGPVGRWLLLARVPGPGRCGPSTVIGQATTRFGEPLNVPASPPGKMTVATFSITSPALARAEAAALKGPEVYLTAWYGGAVSQKYRFITGTAADAARARRACIAPVPAGLHAARDAQDRVHGRRVVVGAGVRARHLLCGEPEPAVAGGRRRFSPLRAVHIPRSVPFPRHSMPLSVHISPFGVGSARIEQLTRREPFSAPKPAVQRAGGPEGRRSRGPAVQRGGKTAAPTRSPLPPAPAAGVSWAGPLHSRRARRRWPKRDGRATR